MKRITKIMVVVSILIIGCGWFFYRQHTIKENNRRLILLGKDEQAKREIFVKTILKHQKRQLKEIQAWTNNLDQLSPEEKAERRRQFYKHYNLNLNE